ncbi:regulator of nonsense transcripts 3B isoform X1 [Homalodisca vitripennis]|uniref:regulator of nonsense transcripts 3B isoform X1 n=1 Tax=Homalodisca vitripennis TaxID=197043 RepID=UPI001EECCF20|nr:regulator of nonsense transcripts 3B isoform X1 [Homalodisca vitripennis]
MKEEKIALKSSAGKENEPVLENGKKKGKEERPATKIVVRRLPPSMTEEQFKNQVSPLPDIDYFYFVPADMSLTPNAFCRAYINFVDQADLFIFTQKFDGYVFVDSKGTEYPAVVEFAPFQRIPKNRPNRKKDPKVGTIEADPSFIAFKERLEAESLENKTAVNASKQHFFETNLVPEKKEAINTPLLDYIKHRRAEKQKAREEKREEKRKRDLDRKKAKEEQRRIKKEEDSSVVKTSSTSPVSPKPKSPAQPILPLPLTSNKKDDKVEDRVGDKVHHSQKKEKQPPPSHKTVREELEVTTKVLNSQNTNKEKPKDKEVKSYVKKKPDEEKLSGKEKSSAESRSKESKVRTGKSYQEERQRQAERREEQRRKLSQSQSSSSVPEAKSLTTTEDKTTAGGEEKPSEEKTVASESKGKEYRKPERAFKREEVRKNSYKYEKYDSKRDRDIDETRRPRRTTSERSYQNNRRDDERSEDGGRKRYSESRRNHDSAQRDRYKDKNKAYSQKKSYGSTTEIDKSKNSAESTTKTSGSSDTVNESTGKSASDAKEEIESVENDLKMEAQSVSSNKEASRETETKDLGAKRKVFELKDKTKPTRRKSLDYDKSKSSSNYSSNKGYSREKCPERKRRNSVGSSKQNQDSSDESKGFLAKEETSREAEPKEGSPTDHENEISKSEEIIPKENTDMEFDEKDRNIPKRRNSTGDRQGTEKQSPRRNSLGSEDKTQVSNFKDLKFDRDLSSEESKPRNEKGTERSSRDPRTERRIRNKDRPSIEIYRPGMGRFSKQRLEREKGLGSSTEVDSPSSSPSPTPVLKHKLVPH